MSEVSKKVDIKVDVNAKQAIAELKKISTAQEGVAKSTKDAAASLDRQAKSLKSIDFKSTLTAMTSAVSLAQQAAVAIDNVSQRSLAYSNVVGNLKISLDEAQRSTGGLVDKFTLAKQASQALRLGVVKNSEDFAELAGLATKLALSTGQDATKGVEDLTTALARQSPKILDNLGITLKQEEAYRIYADSLGKSTSALTEQERAEAFAKAALIKGREAVKDINIATDTWAGVIQKTKVALIDLADTGLNRFGKGLQRAGDDLADFMTEMSSSVSLMERFYAASAGSFNGKTTKDRGVGGIGAKEGDAGFSAIMSGGLDRLKEINSEFDASIAEFDANMAEIEKLDQWAIEHQKKAKKRGGATKQDRMGINAGGLLGDLGREEGFRSIDRSAFDEAQRAQAEKRAAIAAQEQQMVADALQQGLSQRLEIQRGYDEAKLAEQMRAVEVAKAAGVDPMTIIAAQEQAQVAFHERELERLRQQNADELSILAEKEAIKQTQHDAHMQRLSEAAKAEQLHAKQIQKYAGVSIKAFGDVAGAAVSSLFDQDQSLAESVKVFAKQGAERLTVTAVSEAFQAAAYAIVAPPLAAAHLQASATAAAGAATMGAAYGIAAGLSGGRGGSSGTGAPGSFGPGASGGPSTSSSTSGTSAPPPVSRSGSSGPHAPPGSSGSGGKNVQVFLGEGSIKAIAANDAEVGLYIRKVIQQSEQEAGL